MDGQESPLAGRSDLETTRQKIVRRIWRHSDPGKGGSFPQGGKHCELEGCGRGRVSGRARGSDKFNTTSDRRRRWTACEEIFFSFEGCHKSLDPLGLWIWKNVGTSSR